MRPMSFYRRFVQMVVGIEITWVTRSTPSRCSVAQGRLHSTSSLRLVAQRRPAGSKLPQLPDGLDHPASGIVHFWLGCEAAQTETDGGLRQIVAQTQCLKYIRRLNVV